MEKSVFIPERQAVVNAKDTETADSVVYKFDTQIAGMAPNNYFAMQKIDDGKQEQFIKSEVIAPLFSKVKDRKSKISAPFVSALEATRQYDENLSTVAGGETQNKDYVVPFVKGAARGVSDFVVDTVAGAYYEGQDFGAGLAAWQTGDEVNTDITPELQQSIAQFNHLKDKYYQKFGLTLDENDSEVAANLGATVSSLGLSVGAFWALKNPYAAMTLFGANSQASSYMELRQKGVKPLEAFAVSTALGTATGVLEKWGVQNLLSAWATRRFRSAVFKNSVSKYAVPYLKAAAAEGVTEASQSGAESLYMYPYRDDRAEQILNDMVQSGFYGSVGGILGLGGLQIATRKKRASYKQVLVDTLGYEPSYAQELVDAAYLDDETAQKELKEIIDNEVISVLENDQADNMMQETLDQGKALYEKIAEQKAAGLSDALMARVDEIGKNIEEEAIAAGVDKKEAKAAASLSSAMIRGVARAAEEQGLDVDQVIEQSLVKIENRPESQKFVDENMQEVEVDFEPEEELNLSIEPMSAEQIQDEVDAERIALMVEDGQMSEAEATFRVKTGREPTEMDKILGYDFIPYGMERSLEEQRMVAADFMDSPQSLDTLPQTEEQQPLEPLNEQSQLNQEPVAEEQADFENFLPQDKETAEALAAVAENIDEIENTKTVTENVTESVTENTNEPMAEVQSELENELDASSPEETLVVEEEEHKARIEDFGEKIHGARKDLWTDYGRKMSEDLPEDVAAIKMSAVFPEPDYSAAIAAGTDVNVLAAVKALRDSIPVKPRTSYRLQKWVESLKSTRELARQLIDGSLDLESLNAVLRDGGYFLRKIRKMIETYQLLGYPDFIKAKNYYISSGNFTYYGGKEYPGGRIGYTIDKNGRSGNKVYDELQDAVEALRNLLNNGPKNRKTTLDIYMVRKTGDVVIGKKVAAGKFIDLKTGFNTAKEAREYLLANEDSLIAELEKLKIEPKTRRDINNARIGEVYRNGDVAPEQFADTFGFRGVQFGNWVEQKKRVQDLNQAYDALVDLSKIIDVPTRALSLNGTLGLAFGARGTGGKNAALAHYEPLQVVINLTKKNGAGSLGHEWFHALDNNLAVRENKEFLSEDNYMKLLKSLRPEVVKAFSDLQKALIRSDMYERAQKLDNYRSKDYWSTGREMAARAFESYLLHKAKQKGISNDYLVNIIDEEAFENDEHFAYVKKSEQEEIFAAFDNLFNTLKTRETDKGVEFYQLGEPKSLPVKISGKEFGEYTGDRKTYGKAFAKYYKDNIAGKSVISPVLGEVKFFNSAIDETEHWNKLTPENLKYIAAVPEIIATSRDVTEEAPKHTRKDDIVTFYRVRGNVDINGNVKNIAVVIAEDRYGNKYYSLDAKEKSSLTDTAVNGQALGELRSISAYDNSMPQNGDGVNDTFYQTSDERLAQNYKNINKVQNSGLVYPVLGQYEPASKVITLFKGRNPTTLTHELLHHYLPIYLNMMEQGGKIDDLKGLYQELGVDSVQRMQRQHWEKLVDMGTAYFYHKKAPNQSSQTIFEYAKSWAIDVYETVKRFIKPSDEVTKFFEKLISDEEIPDINRLKGKTKELSKILAGARNGQELTIDGVSLRDVAALRRALHARVPAKGVNLATLIRQAGGLDADAQFAKQLGFDAKKGYEGGFWRKGGAIKNEQSLIEFLKDNGFLADIDTQSYEETSDLWNKVEDLIYNKDDAYNFNEAGKNARRENAVLARDMVEQLLRDVYDKDIDLLDQDLKAATKLLAEHGAVAVDKATLEYLNYSVKKLGKDYQKLLYQKKEERYAYQQKLTDFIKDLPNNFKDKAKFMDKIRMVKDERTFNKYLTEIKNRAEEYLKSEQKRLYADLIQKEVKSSRPRKLKMQKYDYENNTLFRDLREYNKLTADAAALKLATLPEDSLDEARALRLRRMFLQYKANGVKSSPELLQQLYEEIAAAKEQGRMAKEENDFIKGFERREQREKLLEILDNSEADKNLKSTQALNAYRRGISNLYTMLNSLFGKDVADKYEFETVLDRKETKEWKHLKKINKRAMQIYKLKDYGDLLNTMADKGQIVTTLYRKEQSQLPDVENYDEKMRYDLSLLDIMDIYNAVKNKKSREDYYRVYGQAQVNKTLELLLPEDRAFADMLMEDVNSYFDEINKIYIKTYGIDLPKVENYWMSTASHLENQDMFGTVTAATSNVPSFMKERSAGAVVPLPKSAWIKYQKHIAQTYYMLEVAEKWADLSKMFSSEEMKNRIENHFGEKVYDNLKRQIDSIGLNAQTPSVDDVSGVFNSMVNGWVGAKIALNPVVFVGQLTSFTNYVEGVDAKQWLKNTLYAMRHPLEVKDFMMQHHGDFLMHRFESGFNEAMNRFIKEASSSQKSRFGLSPKARKSYSDVLSSFVRIGDLGAIIYGGYGQYKTMLDNGMSEAEAKRKFEFNTLRSQQSGNAASISLWQQNKGIARLFLSFKNTSLQYTRKIIDTIMMAKRGDMSMAEARKVLLNYVIIQPALWMVAKNIAKAILQLDDDDDKITDGVLEQVLVNPIESIPVVSDLVKAGMKAATDQPVYSVFSMPLLDDVEKSLRRAKKDDKTVYDYVDVVAPFIEMTTTLPVATAKRYIKTWSGKWEN